MNSLSVTGLFQYCVNLEIETKETSVRKRVKSKFLSKGDDVGKQTTGMVPKIAVVSYDEEDLSDRENGESHHLLNEWTESREDESFENKHLGKRNGDISSSSHEHLNGDISYENSDQRIQLLQEEGIDEFKTDIVGSSDTNVEEGSFTIGLQVFFPFLIAGFGTVSAGILLDVVQVRHYSVSSTTMIMMTFFSLIE